MINSFILKSQLKVDLPNADVYITDGNYMAPKKSWVSGKLYFKLFSEWLWDNGLDTWKSHWDCDNFAFAFFTFAQICHSKTMKLFENQGKRTAQGISVGVMFYKKGIDKSAGEKGGGHAINVVYTDNKVEYFEPQNGQFVDLTNDERESCWFVTF
jgi:hypothetical protein